MSLEEPADDEVMALRYDEPAAAEELARWCGGEVATLQDEPGTVVILVPTAVGALPARVGDWVVRSSDGEFRPRSHENFVAQFQPAEEPAAPPQP